MAEFVAGRLLVASPKLVEPNFARSVVYIGMHDENGAFGLVLNRPLQLDLGDRLQDWEQVVSAPAVLFQGGPVETSAVVALARPLDGVLDGWTAMAAGVGLVDLRRPASEIAPGIADLRMFLGYSGWTAGQLEDEIAREDWFAVDAEHDDLFTPDATRLWHRVLRRQPGKLAMFAYFPEDPSLN